MIAFLSISEAVTPPAPISSERTTSTYEGIITMTTTGEDTRPLPLIGQVTGPMLATIDRADLDTTIRTLQEITRRARETNTTEGNR
jgi:hypothetical protein